MENSRWGKWPRWGDPLPWERLQEFERPLREQAWRDGVELPKNLEWDGDVHKFPGAGKGRGNTSARYLLRADWPPNGWYMDYTQGHDDPIPWKFDTRDLGAEYRTFQETPEAKEARKRYEERRKREEEEVKARKAAVLQKATQLYERSPECPPSHAYFKGKGILPPAGVKVDKKTGNALLPLYDERGRLQCVQRIPTDGGPKKHWKDTSPTGAWFTFGPDITEGPVLVCEGIATAASVFQCTESRYMTICATSSGNLKPVCEGLRRKFPGRQIIIMADDDAKTAQSNSKDGKPGRNSGMAAAAECLKERICDGICPPPFDRAQDGMSGSDWNDYHALHGEGDTAEALSKGITDALSKTDEPQTAATKKPLSDFCLSLNRQLESAPIELIGGMFPRGHVSAIVAAAGTGKTWFTLRLATDLSNGGSILDGFTETEPSKVLTLSGEMGKNMLIERLKRSPWAPNGEYNKLVDLNDVQSAGYSLDLSKAEGQDTLSRLLDELESDIVFVDSLFSFAPEADENKSAVLNPLFQYFIKLAKERDMAVALVHHTRKRKNFERKLPLTQDDTIGSSILNRSVAQLIGLQSLSQLQGIEEDGDMAPVLVKPLKSWFRYFKKFTFQIIDTPLGGVDMRVDLAPNVGSQNTTGQLLEFILENFEPGEEFKAGDLKGFKAIGATAIRNALGKLSEEGTLQRTGDYKGTRYKLPPRKQ